MKQKTPYRIIHVVGARPNFMKAAPVMAALAARPGIEQVLVHTGQHYDAGMSDIFFQQLGLPRPDVNLEVGSASHAEQTARIMTRFERVLLERKPDLVLVYGDVNSTVAATLTAVKRGVLVGHVEAGLRSFDRTMPEEINRLVTDQIADLLFTPSADGDENLLREGVASEKIHRVGNVMIDTLVRLLPDADGRGAPDGDFCLVTLHRPSNVDDPARLERIMAALDETGRRLPVLFPVHPRTRGRLDEIGFRASDRVRPADPAPYLTFLGWQKKAKVVVTDSGGIQEETTFLGVPCLTMRENTERPITVDLGTNILVGDDLDRLRAEIDRILSGKGKTGRIPPLWDGLAGERIADVITGRIG